MVSLMLLLGLSSVGQFGVIGIWLMFFNPIVASSIAWPLVIAFFLWMSSVPSFKWLYYGLLAALLVMYGTDTVMALQRVAFAWNLEPQQTVYSKSALPPQLVLLGVPCVTECHRLLIDGALQDVIVARRDSAVDPKKLSVVRYRADWVDPGTCSDERRRAIYFVKEFERIGYCPHIEPASLPLEGVFLVHETFSLEPVERAQPYSPANLAVAPPGPVIHFAGVEVQHRRGSGITVLAAAYYYEAPGILGSPPLIGCWDRPSGGHSILPPGDTGCGFWRWIVRGGSAVAVTKTSWAYADVFDRPAKSTRPEDAVDK